MVMNYDLYACKRLKIKFNFKLNFIHQKIIEFNILEYVGKKCCFKVRFIFHQN